MARSTDLLRELNGEIVCAKPREHWARRPWKCDAAALVFAGVGTWLLAVTGLPFWVFLLTTAALATPTLMLLVLTRPSWARRVLRLGAGERIEKPALPHEP